MIPYIYIYRFESKLNQNSVLTVSRFFLIGFELILLIWPAIDLSLSINLIKINLTRPDLNRFKKKVFVNNF